MGESPQPDPRIPRPRVNKEYEDPHFHDEDDLVQPADEGQHTANRPPTRPSRKLPPPPRRFPEE